MTSEPFAGRYADLQLVGRGGFGAVYRAYDLKLKCIRALKLLNPERAADEDYRERFRREATAAAGLSHPNITVVFDEGIFGDQPYIVMEYVEGEPLSRLIETPLTLDDAARLELIEQLCDGLHYAHRRGVIHRDIKPVNLLVREDREGTHVVRTLKILDFGIAKVHNASNTLTGGQLMFTANYVSPEQIRGFDASPHSDMFAVGAVAYELLVQRKAFDIRPKNQFEIFEELKRKIVELPHVPMATIRPGIDAELATIVDRALAKDPEARFRDLGEMRRQVARVRERLERQRSESRGAPTAQLSAEDVLREQRETEAAGQPVEDEGRTKLVRVAAPTQAPAEALPPTPAPARALALPDDASGVSGKATRRRPRALAIWGGIAASVALVVAVAVSRLPTRPPTNPVSTDTPAATTTILVPAPTTTPAAIDPAPAAATPVDVTLDAQPWARFVVRATDPDAKQGPVQGVTPAHISLLPGQYVVDLENGGVTQPLRQGLVVGRGPVQRAFVMPGFDADRAATALLVDEPSNDPAGTGGRVR